MNLTDDDLRRYARQIMLERVGQAGQLKLQTSSVLVIGAGGLGSAVIAYLTAAGIGKIGVIDHDHVELSNLQRQILFEHADQGRLKVESAADRISEMNPHTQVVVYPRRVTADNATYLLRGYDVIADGSDNFTTRMAVNAACVALKIPLVSAAVKGFEGQLSSFAPHDDGACYHCLVPEIPPALNNCTQVGVIGPLCGIMGSMQALEIIKHLLQLSGRLQGKLLRFDGMTYRQRISTIARNPECVVCSTCKPGSNVA